MNLRPSRSRSRIRRQLDTITAGVNWYWRSNFKFMLDYVKASSERGGVSDDPGILEARAQFFW